MATDNENVNDVGDVEKAEGDNDVASNWAKYFKALLQT